MLWPGFSRLIDWRLSVLEHAVEHGHVWGWANNGSPHRANGTGYKDKDTGARKFDDGSFGKGDPRFYRPINP
jgi:hypothetical protein